MALPRVAEANVRLHLHRKASVILGLLDKLFPFEYSDSDEATKIAISVAEKVEVSFLVKPDGVESYQAAYRSRDGSWHTHSEEHES